VPRGLRYRCAPAKRERKASHAQLQFATGRAGPTLDSGASECEIRRSLRLNESRENRAGCVSWLMGHHRFACLVGVLMLGLLISGSSLARTGGGLPSNLRSKLVTIGLECKKETNGYGDCEASPKDLPTWKKPAPILAQAKTLSKAVTICNAVRPSSAHRALTFIRLVWWDNSKTTLTCYWGGSPGLNTGQTMTVTAP